MGIGKAANTHVMYQTIYHEHLDSVVFWAMGAGIDVDFPESGINLVKCMSGKWFVEVDHGNCFDNLDGLSKPEIAPFIEPTFFNSEDEARDFAYECIKSVYPDLKNKDLNGYYS
ncbi:hypothetical protein ACWM3R_001402 [Vibrio cholerae]